jgi:hypothetical protein
MKYLKITFAIILISIFFACSKSDDNSNTESLVGKWKIVKTGAIENGQEIDVAAFENENGCENSYFEFTQDNVFKLGSYTNPNCVLSEATGVYTQNGKKIKIGDGTLQVYEIESIIKTDLKLKFKNLASMPDFTDTFYCKKI